MHGLKILKLKRYESYWIEMTIFKTNILKWWLDNLNGCKLYFTPKKYNGIENFTSKNLE